MYTLDLQSPDSYENSFHRVDLDKHTNLELKYSNLKIQPIRCLERVKAV